MSVNEVKKVFDELGIDWKALKKLVKWYERLEKQESQVKKLTGMDKAWRAMKVAKTFTPVGISRLAGIRYRTCVNYICRYVKMGKVKKIGKKGKKQYYRVIEDEI